MCEVSIWGRGRNKSRPWEHVPNTKTATNNTVGLYQSIVYEYDTKYTCWCIWQ